MSTTTRFHGETRKIFSSYSFLSGASFMSALAIFDLQMALIFPTKFGVNWLSVQEKKSKINFQDGSHGGHLRFRI